MPCTPAEMLRRLNNVNLTTIAGDVAEQHLPELAELNKKQLLQGKNNKGELLSPKHSENPWFKKPGAAERYAQWKHRLNPEAPFDVPDLKITGVYHDSISFSRRGDTLSAEASAPFAPSIEQTFNGTPLGLDDESKKDAWSEIIRSPLIHIVADKLGVSVIQS